MKPFQDRIKELEAEVAELIATNRAGIAGWKKDRDELRGLAERLVEALLASQLGLPQSIAEQCEQVLAEANKILGGGAD